MKRLLLISISIIFTSIIPSTAKDYIFHQIQVSDGLSDSRIRKLGMSDDGVLCIRTNTMIDMYNGATFSHYRFDPSQVIYNEYMGDYDLKFDHMGRLWLQNMDNIWALDMDSGQWIYKCADIFTEMGVTEKVSTLFIDNDYNYWMSVASGTLFMYNPFTDTLTDICKSASIPRDMVQDGNIYWILFEDNTLMCWDTSKSVSLLTIEDFIGTPKAERVDISLTHDGNLWVMHDQGIFYFNTEKRRKHIIEGISLKDSDLLTAIDIDSNSDVWVGSSKSGLMVIDGVTFKVSHVPLNLMDGKTVSNSIDISDILIDNNGIVWIATSKEGLLYYHESMTKFGNITPESTKGRKWEENVKCMLPLADGTVLLGTVKGVYCYDSKDNSIRIPEGFKSLSGELCTGLYQDMRKRIWLATFQNGMFCVDGTSVRHYSYDKSLMHINYYEDRPSYNSSRMFFEDSKGNFWVSVYGGAGKFDTATGKISLLCDRHKNIAHIKLVRNIIQLDPVTLLIAGDNGMFTYNTVKDSVAFNAGEQQFVGRTTKHNCVFMDSRGLLWFATHDGLDVYDTATGYKYSIDPLEHALENVFGVIEDDNAEIWVSAQEAIVWISVSKTGDRYSFITNSYNSDDGMRNSTFYEHSICRSSDGSIWFGGTHGVTRVVPQDIKNNSCKSIPRIYGLKIFNEPVGIGMAYNGRVLLENHISKTGTLVLRHNENVITLDISGLNYINPSRTYFRYMLEGEDNRWTEKCCKVCSVTYSNLKPGKYRFMVYTANSDRLWSQQPAIIKITIRPPFYAGIFASITYVIIMTAGSIGIAVVIRSRRKKEKERPPEKQSNHSQKIDINPTETAISSSDEKLIEKALLCVEKNMADPDFSVEILSASLGMTRMNLYRKLTTILGQTPAHFIRSIRLKRAAQLLHSGKTTVSEVCYMVGFNKPAVFSKYFKEEFGMTPSAYADSFSE